MADRALLQDIADSVAGLRRYALLLTGDRHDADDLVQETVAKAIAAASGWRPGSNLRAWLFTILRNTHLSAVRRTRPSASLDDGIPEPAGPPRQGQLVELRQILEAVAALPPHQREAVELIALEDMSYQDAARVLGIPIGTFMSRLARGREALRRRLDGEDGGENVVQLRILGRDR
jgi:RNA polymerase sigma-70 factor (ECF subfamily)